MIPKKFWELGFQVPILFPRPRHHTSFRTRNKIKNCKHTAFSKSNFCSCASHCLLIFEINSMPCFCSSRWSSFTSRKCCFLKCNTCFIKYRSTICYCYGLCLNYMNKDRKYFDVCLSCMYSFLRAFFSRMSLSSSL